jgi:hypothetical protein
MFTHRSTAATIVTLLLALSVSTVEGQQVAGSFEQLRARVAVGDTVTVIDVQGRETSGTITDLSVSSLTLMMDRAEKEFLEADVERVSRRDSRWNGTLWGLGVGGVLGAWADHGLVDEYGREDISVGESVEFIAVAAAVGAGIGFAVDALIGGKQLLYSRSGNSMRRDATIVPTVSGRRRGIFLSVRF